MKLLVTNPNISQSVSSLIQGEAERSAFAGTQITMLTAPFGIAYIETRFEALVGAYASAQLAAVHHTGHEAVIVAAFGDPGLAGLRDVLPVPVLGQTESTLASASLLGHRFSIVTISQRIQAWYREVVEANGMIGGWPAFARSTSRVRASATCRPSTKGHCARCATVAWPRARRASS